MIEHPLGKVVSISLRMATPEDAYMDAFDNTRLVAVNTCPTWGVLRYGMHKTHAGAGRAMALEAGSALHEVFAAVRLLQLYQHDSIESPHRSKIFENQGVKLFGDRRFADMLQHLTTTEDERTQNMNFCMEALASSGFYDDPSDRRRTMSNLEEAAILYIDRWNPKRHPIWVRDWYDPSTDVGIEVGFDVVISYTFNSGAVIERRFVGKLDGLHYRDGKLIVGENKTASRLDDAWRMSFHLATQVTGYNLAATTWTGEACTKGIIWGLAIPLPKSYDLGGLITEHVSREDYHFDRWFKWFLHSSEYYVKYRNNPHETPQYTHSCNRYFRSCSFIPFCDSSLEDQKLMVEEMVTEEWNPIAEASQGGD